MELTIEQVLQQAMAAHKEGKLQDAERLYRRILQPQPLHPDANHNLGLLAVSVNKAGAALPLFKIALEANPKIEQFWLSYIDALIKEKQFENAKKFLKKAKKQGVNKKKLSSLKAQIALMPQTENANSSCPSAQQVNNLLEDYQTGRYDDAEKSARALSLEYPSDNFSWKVLEAVLKQTNRMTEAAVAGQKAVEINPRDVEAHNNLGVTLQELGRLAEAEASYKQAIALKPEYTEAHSNLGVTLKDLGRLNEAEASYRQAITLKPGLAEAHSNLGDTLKDLGRLNEAEASYKQAIILKPHFAEAHSNLGVTLKELGRTEDAEVSLRKAIALKSDYSEAHYNLGMMFDSMGKYEEAIEHFSLINFKKSKSYLLRCLYFQNKRSLFFDQLDTLIAQGETNSVIGSLGCRSALTFGIEKPNLFCKEPLKYVLKTNLKERYDFKKLLINPAIAISNKNEIGYRAQNLLSHGSQTYGNLFDVEPELTKGIQEIIRAEVDKYRFNFAESQEGFIKNWPARYSIRGWLISMKSGGELRSHMHEEGWISGSVYLNVPHKLKPDSGNLVVCIEDEKFMEEGKKNPKNIIDVVTGNLVLFPASLLHYTIPFDSKDERTVLAFDVIPAA